MPDSFFDMETELFTQLQQLADSVTHRKEKFDKYVERLNPIKRNTPYIQGVYREILDQERKLTQINTLLNSYIQRRNSSSIQTIYVDKFCNNCVHSINEADPFMKEDHRRISLIEYQRKWEDHL